MLEILKNESRNININNHLPLYVKNLEELKQITNTENPEILLLIEELEKVLNNFFVKTCDIKTVENYEKLLDIKVNPLISINTRKDNILFNMGSQIPFTKLNLENILNNKLDNKYKINIKHEEFIIEIETYIFDANKKDFILRTLRKIIPANMIIQNNNILSFEIEKLIVNSSVSFILEKEYIIR